MAEIGFGGGASGAAVGNNLQTMMQAEDIKPGDSPSYELCKTIYSYHPLGKKLADTPVVMAMSKAREISAGKGPAAEKVAKQFVDQWKRDKVDSRIRNVARLARIYGVASIALMQKDVDVGEPVDEKNLGKAPISFNTYDPLNTAGSLVLEQNPLSPNFQQVLGISVQGKAFHPTRSLTLLHEDPIYIEWTTSSFGYVGRSVYQRPLFPLKSYLQLLITNNQVALKAGVLIAKIKGAGSVVDQTMQEMAGIKRNIVKQAVTTNVINIEPEEEVESLNFQNLDGPLALVRKNIIEDIATAADMPALIINQETFAEGFGEGSEDAMYVANYIGTVRDWLAPAYVFMDRIEMRRAWTPEFFKTMQAEFPDRYGDMTYDQAFQEWKNAFEGNWPALIEEPESERVQVDDVILKAVIAWFQVLSPVLDPENKIEMIRWAVERFNVMKRLFPIPLTLNYEALEDYDPVEAMGGMEGDEEAGADAAKVKLGRADSVISLAEIKADMESSVSKVVARHKERRAAYLQRKAQRRAMLRA